MVRQGARLLYVRLLRPLLRRHQGRMDRLVTGTRAHLVSTGAAPRRAAPLLVSFLLTTSHADYMLKRTFEERPRVLERDFVDMPMPFIGSSLQT